jgi:hypothetical protein
MLLHLPTYSALFSSLQLTYIQTFCSSHLISSPHLSSTIHPSIYLANQPTNQPTNNSRNTQVPTTYPSMFSLMYAQSHILIHRILHIIHQYFVHARIRKNSTLHLRNPDRANASCLHPPPSCSLLTHTLNSAYRRNLSFWVGVGGLLPLPLAIRMFPPLPFLPNTLVLFALAVALTRQSIPEVQGKYRYATLAGSYRCFHPPHTPPQGHSILSHLIQYPHPNNITKHDTAPPSLFYKWVS